MNKLKLEYEMKMKGITMAEMCNMLQISRSAFLSQVQRESGVYQKGD